jgi:hypothetical protein
MGKIFALKEKVYIFAVRLEFKPNALKFFENTGRKVQGSKYLKNKENESVDSFK